MPTLELHPLSGLREEAAGLLAERYAAQRRAEALLPEVDDLAAHIPDEEGLVATRGGRAVAYVAGRIDGSTARVGFAGCAASEPEALRDVYAALAAGWGVSRFAVAVPASDRGLIDAWFRLAFGCQFVWAVRETADASTPPPGWTIREGTPADLDTVVALDELRWTLQAGSPSFSGAGSPGREELREEWRDLWDDRETFRHFVAERDGRAVGHAVLYRRPEGDLRVPAANVDLAHAATLEEVRGQGAGLALTHHALAWAREHGFRSITADWRMVNLLSSRFWRRRGFRPQYLRLYRAVP
jgi:GNAT superfamily N-acetyltransferase